MKLFKDPVVLDRKFTLDWRSLDYPVSSLVEGMYRPRSYTWGIDSWLDQGQEGACVGYAYAHELIARPVVVVGINNEYARNIYWEAQMVDEWEGGAYPGAAPVYEGTSVLAGAKTLQTQGFFSSYSWGLDAEEVARGVGYFGPAVLGTNWYEGMFNPDPQGFLRPTGRLSGGHAILICGIKIVYNSYLTWRNRTWRDVDFQRSYVVVHNSWGKEWGNNGRAKISLTDLARLMSEDGDVCFPQRTNKITI